MSLKELQDEFYVKLKAEGFEDIEDIRKPDRPLKEWHNLKFASEQAQKKIALRSEYQKLVSAFTNREDFEEICKLIVHDNKLGRPTQIGISYVKQIWQLYSSEGWTERRIASELKVSKTCIHEVLKRLDEWMKLA